MYKINFKKPCHVHMIGIGGISMSGLAEILMNEGFTMSGSDRVRSGLVQGLEKKGARIAIGQAAENITPDIDCVVYTAAIHPDNPEYMAAEAMGLPMLTRAELLGQIMQEYPQSVAISGTHGKTTTTSMITNILLAEGKDPTVSVGGMLDSIDGNIHIGSDPVFVTEACEYTNSFLEFFPTLEIILNVEADHLDFFKDLDDIRNSFRLFVKKLPEDGTVVINSIIRAPEEILDGFKGDVITFGGPGADYRAEAVKFDENAFPSFDLLVHGEHAGRIRLSVPGAHNVMNALAAIAAATKLGAGMEAVKEGLAGFTGAQRRFEKKGELGGIRIYDDYAHHPQEIEATLAAARHVPHDRLVCVFQPHTYSRTKSLLQEFGRSLALADITVLTDIYPARETDTLGISSRDVARLVNENGGHAVYAPSFDDVETYLLSELHEGDLCITMGAGDVVLVGERLLGL